MVETVAGIGIGIVGGEARATEEEVVVHLDRIPALDRGLL